MFSVLKNKLGEILNPHIPRYDILKYDLKDSVEVKTGEKRDGKDVYKKLIKISSLPNATTQKYNHNISNVDKIWYDFSESLITFSNGQRASFPYLGGNMNALIELQGLDTTQFTLTTSGVDRRTCSAEVCLKYTKK